jgi:putative PIN family toxin of toxin-antitoxin system
MKRIVLDTNVLVSALLNPKGPPAQIWTQVLAGNFGLVYDNYLFSEYSDVLNRSKFHINKVLINIVLDFVANEGEFALALPVDKNFEDPKDKPIYELYIGSGADWLITGNTRHFPDEPRIISPHDALIAYLSSQRH